MRLVEFEVICKHHLGSWNVIVNPRGVIVFPFKWFSMDSVAQWVFALHFSAFPVEKYVFVHYVYCLQIKHIKTSAVIVCFDGTQFKVHSNNYPRVLYPFFFDRNQEGLYGLISIQSNKINCLSIGWLNWCNDMVL